MPQRYFCGNAASRRCVLSLAMVLSGVASPGWAQVQRSFINEGFELPVLSSATDGAECFVETSSDEVPGWETTHPDMNGRGNCASPSHKSGRLIELRKGASSGGGVVAREGIGFAELNASLPSRIYQNICLQKGETIRWQFSHRGRLGTDVAQLNITSGNSSTEPVVDITSGTDGTFEVPTQHQNNLVLFHHDVSAQPHMAGANPTGWVDYAGSFAYGGETGAASLGFESISAAGGDKAYGNFLDGVQIGITPFVDFVSAATAARESEGNNLPRLRINGNVTTAFDVVVRIVGGTAIGPGGATGAAVDYSTPSGTDTLTIRIPAGLYDGAGAGSLIALPVSIIKDSVAEPGKTIRFAIQEAPGPLPSYLRASNAACGDAPVVESEYTIIDGGLDLVRAVGEPVPVAGSLSQYDVAYTVRASNATGAELAYDLSDALATDPGIGSVSVQSLSCSSSGSVSSCGDNLPGKLPAGAGPWQLNQTRRSLESGAVDTYTLVVRFSVLPAAGVRACAGAGTGLFGLATATVLNGTPASVQSEACVDTPPTARVMLTQQVASRVASTDQFQVKITSGGATAGMATTAGAATSASTAQIVVPAGAALQFTEVLKANGSGPDLVPDGYVAELSCTNGSAGSTTALPSGAGTATASALQWPAITPAAGDLLDCTVVSTARPPKLVVGLEASAKHSEPGKTVNYVITVGNAGPVATTAPIQVRDVVSAGLTLGSLPAGCTASGQTVSCEIAAGLPGRAPGAVTAVGRAAEIRFTIPVTVTPGATSGGNTVQVWGGGDPACTEASPCSASASFSLPAPGARPVPVDSRSMLGLLGMVLAAFAALQLRSRSARRPE